MFISLDTRRTSQEELSGLVRRCGLSDEGRAVVALGRIVEALANSYPADSGRWKIEDVF